MKLVTRPAITGTASASAIFRAIYEDNDPTKRILVMINYNTDISEFWEWSDTGLKPIDDPDLDLESVPEEGDLTFQATVQVRPVATLGEYGAQTVYTCSDPAYNEVLLGALLPLGSLGGALLGPLEWLDPLEPELLLEGDPPLGSLGALLLGLPLLLLGLLLGLLLPLDELSELLLLLLLLLAAAAPDSHSIRPSGVSSWLSP